MLECHWKSTLGIECPGCGFQRSVTLLFEGRIWESVVMYPATIPFFITVLYVLLHLRFRFKRGAMITVILFSITALLVAGNFIYRICN